MSLHHLIPFRPRLKTWAATFATLISISAVQQTALASDPLDQLLQRVLTDQTDDALAERNRETAFLLKKEFQKDAVAKAELELKKLEDETNSLTAVFDRNEKELTVLETKLTEASGTLGEMFGTVKQISGDLSSQLENSVVSAELSGRHQFVKGLASQKKLPEAQDLKKLWHTLIGEIIESGQVKTFQAKVVAPSGEASEKAVTRIGAFNLVADGKYLSFQADTQQLVELSRQPAGKHLSSVEDLEDAKPSDDEPIGVSLDPSRGALLGMLVNAPSFSERFHQGGLVGYVITLLMLVGVLIVLERFFVLQKEKKQIDLQLKSDRIDEGNSLGRLLKVFQDNQNESVENLELKLNESILKSLPVLERGIGGLKLLAAIGPLMGLLGTVTGMIDTFQSITMFGTGDPKLMAGGISTALVTTVQGLVCAIPMLLMHAFISSRSKEVVQILTEQSVGLIAEKVGK